MSVNEILNNTFAQTKSDNIVNSAASLQFRKKLNPLTKLARQLVLSKLNNLRVGKLTLIERHKVGTQESFQTHVFGEKTVDFQVEAQITVHHPQFYCDLAFGGSIGAGESYILEYWSSNSLTNVIRIMARNADLMDNMESGVAKITVPVRKALHWLNRNSKQGSRRNIAAHYDIGNDLFELFLDPSMMYSSGIFPNQSADMETASITKLRHICEKLAINENDHVIEIGTGWGGFAIFAAENYGCRVTTTTISKEQFDLATQRIESRGLQDKITVLFQDYRELEGKYDKLVSIEMIEAVGRAYYDSYFEKCAALLHPNGAMLIQAITISDQRFDQASRSVDFIQKYIFPGSCIPSNTAILEAVTRKSDLRLFNLEDIGPHYATTLRKWRERFFANLDKVRELGYGDEFIRMWEFYLCYCEGGFSERAISDVHMIFTKPENRMEPILTKQISD